MNNPHYTIILYRQNNYDYNRNVFFESQFEILETDDRNDVITIIAENNKENHFKDRNCPEIEITILIDGRKEAHCDWDYDTIDRFDSLMDSIFLESRILTPALINKQNKIDEVVRTVHENKRKEAERLEDLRKLEQLKAKLGLKD